MQIKKNIGYFEYSLLVTRIHYISLKLQHFSFFESQSDEGRIQLAIKLFGISKRSRIVSTNYFLFIFLDNISHIFWDQTPHYQCCLQVSKTVSWHKFRCCYSSSMLQCWVRNRGLTYFWKVDHSRISRNFSMNCLCLYNLREIL